MNNLKLQRNLNTVNSATQNALNRISTGYKINNASDDAAGLVISKALETQTRGLDVANNNAQMATNLLNTADGALGQMSDLTMRIRDLATQSANGVYSTTERKALDLEAKELTNNLEQLVKGTKFNEYNIFEGKTKEITTEAEAIAQGYEIVKTAEELKAALTAPDALNNINKKVMLFGDINLDNLGVIDGNNWEAIGVDTDPFRGTFDGNGYTISNLKINKVGAKFQGFFGYASGATIQNIGLKNVDVKAYYYTGGLAGEAYKTTIENAHTTGDVVGSINTGGLIGKISSSSLLKSYSACDVISDDEDTGGLVGDAYNSSIKDSYSKGSVNSKNSAGGLVGLLRNGSKISNSYSTGNVTGRDDTGGFVGKISGLDIRIKNSYATGDVFSRSDVNTYDDIGGFVGWSSGEVTIANSYYAGQNRASVVNRGAFVAEIDSGSLTFDNYAYVTQTTSGVVNGNGVGKNDGTILGTEQTGGQTSNWFNQTSNAASIIGVGSNSWNYDNSPPKLAWQETKSPIAFQIGTDGTNLSAITMDLGFTLGNFKPDFTNAETSRKTMETCDTLLKQINTKRGEIGANTNIISSIIDGNTITNENLTASKSRIQDADIARESASIVKNQILESATSSLLSQSSNINGQLALQLLSGLGGR